MSIPKDPRSGAAAIGGIALIVFGSWWLVQATGIIPAAWFNEFGRAVGALAVIGLGVAVLLASRRSSFAMPAPGTRLYRSRSDRWVAGVLGGLGKYLGVDPVLLRIAVILLTVIGAGSFVVAYIVMWVIVPEEPLVPASAVPTAPAAPAPPIPPAPPVPPAPIN
jgi:phage shock protein C